MKSSMSTTTTSCFTFILLAVVAVVALVALQAEGRALHINSELVSDGVDDVEHENSYYLYDLKEGSESSDGKYCKPMYGFLPCSSNILGHLFLILVYEYLLFHGESYLAAGGEQVFKILGPGIFGASAFDLLGALPESLILLVTGLSGDEESAQEYASTGVGLLAGSSILLLTVVWGTCVLMGSQKFKNDSTSSSNSTTRRIEESLSGSGITMDPDTRKMALIMVFSVIPLIIMQIPSLFQLSSTPFFAVTLIIALAVAVIFLVSYFIYQSWTAIATTLGSTGNNLSIVTRIFEPHIEKTRLDYIKHDDLILKIFQQVEKQTLQKILSEDGTPNVTAISGLYNEISRHGGRHILASEIKELLLQNVTDTNIKEEQIADMLRIFDQNGDQVISKEEFVTGLTQYINQIKHALDKKYLPKESMNNMYQVFIKPWIEHTRKEREMKGHLISGILSHVQSDMVGSLRNDDGSPNEAAIRRLFEEIDSNGDSRVSKSELKDLMEGIHFGKVVDAEEAVAKIIQEIDINNDNEISEMEFLDALKKWMNTTSSSQTPNSISLPHENHQTWEEVEKVVEDNQSKGVRAWLSALGYVMLGITMLSLLAEPLIASVQNFSEEAGISPFFISFILVPLATNFREATSAIKEAGHKKRGNTCHTVYEIYGAVFMNNILGFVVISILIYVRDITWEFSAGVLVVSIVCVVMGLTANFRSTFPLWTSVPAYALYLISLVLVFVLKDVLNYV